MLESIFYRFSDNWFLRGKKFDLMFLDILGQLISGSCDQLRTWRFEAEACQYCNQFTIYIYKVHEYNGFTILTTCPLIVCARIFGILRKKEHGKMLLYQSVRYNGRWALARSYAHKALGRIFLIK